MELRAERSGFSRSGAHFTVWDADARAGAAWAEELAAVDSALATRVCRANADG